MQVTPSFTDPIPSAWTEMAYKTFQWGKNYFAVAHKLLSTRTSHAMSDLAYALQPLLSDRPIPRPARMQGVSETTLELIRQRYEQLLQIDWQEAAAGYYPETLLFDNPWIDFALFYPQVWLDLVSINSRVNRRQYQEFGSDIDTEGYPKYYLQNFHHQTDGYLSDQSASLYDLQVELLFGGSADAMRRRILRSLQDHFRAQDSEAPTKFTRILDVACGTGRTLRMLRQTFPQVALFGVDLSPAYLRKANQLLSELPGELPQLIQTNAEALPYADASFDAVTSVFLFHELPGSARQNVIHEISRVLKPGGVVVICDSIQLSDSPDLVEIMDSFPKLFHEPYYRDYVRDDLGQRFQACGCEVIGVESHFVSRYTTARKRISTPQV